MKFKEWVNCDKCEKPCKNIRIHKGSMLCFRCWTKEVIIIINARYIPLNSFKKFKIEK